MTVMNQTATRTMPPAEKKLITAEELYAMGDIGPCELVQGEIVNMTPTGDKHGNIESNFDVALKQFVRQHKLGHVRVGEVGIVTGRNPDNVRGADVAFISNERYAQRQSSGYLDVAPDLVVEVLSPNDRWTEVMEKLGEYFSIGVRLVWVVEPKTESVFAYRSLTDVRHFAKCDSLPGDDVLPGFVIKVEDVLAD
ncbi:MAG: Uma2 family endonuclease [Chloroflexi bacterium]|nr:Uma2 family endonuclease [Chloroflexota bacterium]